MSNKFSRDGLTDFCAAEHILISYKQKVLEVSVQKRMIKLIRAPKDPTNYCTVYLKTEGKRQFEADVLQ
jgi:hypothetical protein